MCQEPDRHRCQQGRQAEEEEVEPLYLVEQRGVPKSLIDIDASKGAKLKKKK